MPTKRRAYFVWLCILFWLQFKYIWMPILCSIFTRNMKWNSRLAINVARKKQPKPTKERIQILHMSEFNFSNEMPFTCGLAHIHLHRCGFNYILHNNNNNNQTWVRTGQLIPCFFLSSFFFICLLTLSDDWLIDWLPCTTKRNGCNTRYIYCVTDGNWCVTLQIKR